MKDRNRKRCLDYSRSPLSNETRKRAKLKQDQKQKDDIQYRLLRRIKGRAVARNIEFNISMDDITVPEICPVLKTPFDYGTFYTASLDRVDPTKGYIKGNVQVMSHKANAMKNSASNKELHLFADWVKQNVPNI